MSTSIVNGSQVDAVITELLAVAAVTTAFPVTTLSGALAGRMHTAIALVAVTPANMQLKDEQGDVLFFSFLSTTGTKNFYTQKGLKRMALEYGAELGY